jgi:hypothetical protein
MTESKYKVAKNLNNCVRFISTNFVGFEALTFQPCSLRPNEWMLQLGHISTGMQSAFVAPKAT